MAYNFDDTSGKIFLQRKGEEGGSGEPPIPQSGQAARQTADPPPKPTKELLIIFLKVISIHPRGLAGGGRPRAVWCGEGSSSCYA